MKSAVPSVGARLTDSVSSISAAQAKVIAPLGIDGCIRYLGSVTPSEVQGILAAGLGFLPVTYADQFDGAKAVSQVKALGLPVGVTVFLDLEGIGAVTPASLIAQVNGWATQIKNALYIPGLYVGANSILNSQELYGLGVERYWKGLSRIVDRNGLLAEPECGWCMLQLFPTTTRGGISVDIDVVQSDFQNRLPVWAVEDASAG